MSFFAIGGRLMTAALGGALALAILSSSAAAAELDDQIYTFFQIDQNEYRLSDEGEHAYAWYARGWLGPDYAKLFITTEGEQPLDGQLQETEVTLLYSRTTSALFEAHVGVR